MNIPHELQQSISTGGRSQQQDVAKDCAGQLMRSHLRNHLVKGDKILQLFDDMELQIGVLDAPEILPSGSSGWLCCNVMRVHQDGAMQ